MRISPHNIEMSQRVRLTSDNQLGGLCGVVDGRLRHAGVAPGVLQLGVLDKQRAV